MLTIGHYSIRPGVSQTAPAGYFSGKLFPAAPQSPTLSVE
jgi:hypothetical protein